jgi:hypothetical protein
MDDSQKKTFAWSQMNSMKENPPSRLDQEAVQHYHEILNLFVEVYGENADRLRISDEEMKPLATSFQRGAASGRVPPRTQSHPTIRVCSEQLFKQRFQSAYNFFAALEPPSGNSGGKNYGFLNAVRDFDRPGVLRDRWVYGNDSVREEKMHGMFGTSGFGIDSKAIAQSRGRRISIHLP